MKAPGDEYRASVGGNTRLQRISTAARADEHMTTLYLAATVDLRYLNSSWSAELSSVPVTQVFIRMDEMG